MDGITSLIDRLNETLAKPIGRASDFVFNEYTFAMLFAVGIFLTVRLGFVQFRFFGAAFRSFFAAMR